VGLPLVSIRPGIVTRSGGEIPFSPYEGRIQGVPNGPAAWHASGSPRSPRWRRSPAWGGKGVLARVTAMASITAPLSSRTAAADRSLEAPAPGHRDGTTRSPASYPTWAMERQSSVVWCRPAGARKSRGRMLLSDRESAPPTYDLPTDSGLGRTEGDNAPLSMLPASRLTRHACSRKGPERMFTGTAAMKHWKTSFAMYEPRNDCLSFRLDPQWSSYGPILPQGPSRKPEIGPDGKGDTGECH